MRQIDIDRVRVEREESPIMDPAILPKIIEMNIILQKLSPKAKTPDNSTPAMEFVECDAGFLLLRLCC